MASCYNCRMKQAIILTSDDPILRELDFKPYRSSVERHFKRFMPDPDLPQDIDIVTPWGETLTAQAGDYLVSELDKPDDVWPVEADIFESTYTILRSGICIKSALTYLVPMTDLTGGDQDQKITVHALEGPQTVRAGDFYLAKGVQGEIWSYPKEKIGQTMVPAE
jgi:hypothetical protein